MSDCTDSEKPASGDAMSCPKERKNAFPCESGEGLEATSSGPSGHLPLSGEGFAWCRAIMRAERKARPCEPVTSVTGVAPSGGHLSQREARPSWVSSFLCLFWGQYAPFPGKCPVSTSERSPGPCPRRAAPTPPAAARRGRPGRPGADRSRFASGESDRAPCSGG